MDALPIYPVDALPKERKYKIAERFFISLDAFPVDALPIYPVDALNETVRVQWDGQGFKDGQGSMRRSGFQNGQGFKDFKSKVKILSPKPGC